MKHSHKSSIRLFSAFFAIVFAISSVAQIEEIKVTARKKAENLQDIPVQVDVITAQEIERAGITSLEDIAKMSASMVFDNGFSQSDTRITLRGLSPIRGRQNVAVLQDGVDLSSENLTIGGGTSLINSRLFDLERVEVVKGPQSALYGRSAFAGAINYVTKKPTQENQSSISATIASESEMDLRASWSGGINENTAVGVNFASWSRDGYHDNLVSGQPVGGEEGIAGSITFNYEPSEDFSLVTRFEYTDDDFEPAAQYQQSGTTMLPIPANAIAPVNTCIIPTPTMCLAYYTSGKVISPLVTHMPANVGALPNVDDIGGAQLAINPRTGKDYPGANREIQKFSMTAVKEFENVTFTSITGLMEGDVFTFEDPQYRGTTRGPTQFGEIWYDQHTELNSQEFRVQSNTDGPFQWTLGLQLWEQEMQLDDKSFNTFTYLN
ncbi:MAG TPA: TonB-dependent receptor plug domain-containing protein, partial [Gammaproteobacteria bacterium]|nr:TonB-dependent receptor plug domain-containing protein [Gammaproteobacteria bacterium]